MPIANINKVNLYYEHKGSGSEVVVFLNGIAMNTIAWLPQSGYFAKNHQVLVHDLRGQGQSTLTPENFTFEQHAADLNGLLDHLQIEKVHLVGVSYGAEVGMYFALLYPERVKSLTLGTAASYSKPLLKAMIHAWMETVKTYDGELFFNVMAPMVYSNAFYIQYGEVLGRRAEAFGKTATREWMDAFLALCENFLTLDVTERLKEIQAPTLVVSGREDLLKPVFYGELIHQQIPNSKFVVMEDGAHGLFIEKAQEFNQLVEEFIAENH